MNHFSFSKLGGALLLVGVFGPSAASAASENIIYSFCNEDFCADGTGPYGLVNMGGILYGTTFEGGNHDCSYLPDGCGTAFSFNPQTDGFSTLYTFCSQQNCTDGYGPVGLGRARHELYGTTSYGGGGHCPLGCGTLFSLDSSTGAETVVYKFEGGADGANPAGDLHRLHHMMYGVTSEGGAYGEGTAFAVDPRTGSETVLHSFGGPGDGRSPAAGLSVTSTKDTLYGITEYGGSGNCGEGCGTVFSIDPDTGTETVLHSFNTGGDGQYPEGALVHVNGTLYGTTRYGGAEGAGTVFAIDPDTGIETVVYSFAGGADGYQPGAKLLYKDGELYGTTAEGGGSSLCLDGCGTIFSVDVANGTEAVLHAFGSYAGDGQAPFAGLIMLNGTLYGTTSGGGAYGEGTIYVCSLDAVRLAVTTASHGPGQAGRPQRNR